MIDSPARGLPSEKSSRGLPWRLPEARRSHKPRFSARPAGRPRAAEIGMAGAGGRASGIYMGIPDFGASGAVIFIYFFSSKKKQFLMK